MTDISGKAAVVTGGGNGIGMGLAKELARQGASVVVADIILENAQKVAGEINATNGKAVAVQCDVCDKDIGESDGQGRRSGVRADPAGLRQCRGDEFRSA